MMDSSYKSQLTAAERIIVALDVDEPETAREIVGDLSGAVGAFKIGLRLFSRSGPELLREFADAGNRIFLDLKFHDIPNTVADASIEAARMNVWMFNMHASGGHAMMNTAAQRTREFCVTHDIPVPIMLGVTVLTSSDDQMLAEVGVDRSLEQQVERLAHLSLSAGLDGVVASAREAELLRSSLGDDLVIVTPGIRPVDATADDQRRVMTIGRAFASGADHVVIGRPILNSADRRAAVENFVREATEFQFS